ncbi:sulfotransferase 4A1 isoform X1 [Physeter macrocephalus]|uniref:Sulfotransferase n=1 Tax=Physeter macrocephalus TaxID=9755 RepID=A0A9W2WQ89_PHYMC|nr:sulfotransferase 4A1 isoform X1 [Physeter catodon]
MAESEAETPSTPGEFESKYFEFHGVRLPPFCRGKMEEIANFPVRPSDVWIVTYPKSGTSLLQEVVYLVSQGADPDEIGLMNIDEQLPVLEYPQPGLDIIKELTSPRLIKSHLPYRFLPSDLHSGDSKVIYMARNPKDLVVSYYQFHRSLRTMSYRGTFQEFCRRFMNDKLGYGSWFEHVQEFWEHRMDSNVLFLKYEDMHRGDGANLPQPSPPPATSFPFLSSSLPRDLRLVSAPEPLQASSPRPQAALSRSPRPLCVWVPRSGPPSRRRQAVGHTWSCVPPPRTLPRTPPRQQPCLCPQTSALVSSLHTPSPGGLSRASGPQARFGSSPGSSPSARCTFLPGCVVQIADLTSPKQTPEASPRVLCTFTRLHPGQRLCPPLLT